MHEPNTQLIGRRAGTENKWNTKTRSEYEKYLEGHKEEQEQKAEHKNDASSL